MEKNQLKYVVETAKTGNITRAAENLHLTQPSLSNQILALERELGISLFERARKRVYLTEAGRQFVYQAEQLLNGFEDLASTMQDFASLKKGRLAIGVLPIGVQLGIIDMIADFKEEFPDIDITVNEMGSHDLLESLKKGEIDAAFAIISEKPEDPVHSLFYSDAEIVAIIPRIDPLASKKRIRRADLRNRGLILCGGGFNLQRMIEKWLQDDNIPYSVVTVCNQIESCFSMASRNMGISFSSAQVADYYKNENLACVPLEGIPKRKVVLAYTKEPEYHPVLNAFIEFVGDAASGSGRQSQCH